MQTTFFYCEKIPEESSRRSMLFHNLSGIYCIKHKIKHTTFYQSSTWTEIWRTSNGSIYYVLYLQILRFYLVGRIVWHSIHLYFQTIWLIIINEFICSTDMHNSPWTIIGILIKGNFCSSVVFVFCAYLYVRLIQGVTWLFQFSETLQVFILCWSFSNIIPVFIVIWKKQANLQLICTEK